MRETTRALCAIALTCFAIGATPAQAQTPPAAGGLFGSGSKSYRGDHLTMLFDVNSGYGSEPPAVDGSTPAPDAFHTGYNSMLMSSANYGHSGQGYTVGASGSATMGYSKTMGQLVPLSSGLAIDGTGRLPSSVDLQATYVFGYSPSYLYELFPTAAVSDFHPEYQIAQLKSYAQDTRVTLGAGSARATRFTASAEYTHTRFEGAAFDLALWSVDAKLAHAFSTQTTVSGEYEYRTSSYGFLTTREHRATVAATYRYALSQRRHATLRGSLSPSTLDMPAGAFTNIDGTVSSSGHAFTWQGEAGMDYEIRSNWRGTVTYRRELQYLPLVSLPLLTTGTHAEFSAAMTRRFDVTAGGGYATGGSGLDPRTRDLVTSTVDAQGRYGLGRSIATYVEYLYYRYDLHGLAPVAPAFPSGFKQHTIRFGVQLFVRAIGR
jgi:hypothetical protein